MANASVLFIFVGLSPASGAQLCHEEVRSRKKPHPHPTPVCEILAMSTDNLDSSLEMPSKDGLRLGLELDISAHKTSLSD